MAIGPSLPSAITPCSTIERLLCCIKPPDETSTIRLLSWRGELRPGLGNDTSNVTAAKRHEHYTRSPEIQRTMRDVALRVFLENPIYYIATIPVGLFRVLLQVRGPLLLPGLVWNIVLLLVAGVGVWQLSRQRRLINLVFLILPCAYFWAGTLSGLYVLRRYARQCHGQAFAGHHGRARHPAPAQPAKSGVGVPFTPGR